MPLAHPPRAAGSLGRFPAERLASRVLHRVWRYQLGDGRTRPSPWWFASRPADGQAGGRFDLPAPMGSCYLGTRLVAAILEALQARLPDLPRAELQVRRALTTTVPAAMPAAAKLTAARAAAFGITAAVWADHDRGRTQAWAEALRRDGWWALYSGVQHDPSGRLRAVVLFDHAGEHAPTSGGAWDGVPRELDSPEVVDALGRYGIAVRDPGNLPFVDPPT